MYASFRSVTAKNGKILTPTRTGNFLLTSTDPEFYAKHAQLSLTGIVIRLSVYIVIL